MKRWRMVIIGAVSLTALLALSNSALQARRAVGDEALYKELELFTDALSIVQTDYVEQPEAKQLIYGALKGMLSILDPYSQFLDPDSYNELKVDTEGHFGGLGIEITIKDDLLTVITPIDDTPAYNAGLKASDRIVKIDGELTRGITLLEAVKKLRGKPGTTVALTILREGENELKDFTVTRDIIKIKSIRDSRILEAHIGYIRMSDFRENTPEDLEGAVEKLKREGMDSLILDLRNNPGGLLDVAVSAAELFLDRQQMIVSTKGRLKNQNFEFRSRRTGMANGLPLVVLVNEGSASASEILAGAIQDHHRGIILGTKTHGKASVQTIFPLKDGSALRLTTSKYFTPAGRSIHGEGIAPDVVVPLEPSAERAKDADGKDKDQQPEAEELFDKLEHPDDKDQTAKLRMDSQLARAVDLLKGIKVYQQGAMKPANGSSSAKAN
ncbi:MAG: S41 family peptidase [Candidatus Omnitrophica bacterium]|nr:S41 family peptidase [Candidatus Omnitrophota bacterium]